MTSSFTGINDVSANASGVAVNLAGIATLSTQVTQNASDITTANTLIGTKADSSTVTALTGVVTSNAASIVSKVENVAFQASQVLQDVNTLSLLSNVLDGTSSFTQISTTDGTKQWRFRNSTANQWSLERYDDDGTNPTNSWQIQLRVDHDINTNLGSLITGGLICGGAATFASTVVAASTLSAGNISDVNGAITTANTNIVGIVAGTTTLAAVNTSGAIIAAGNISAATANVTTLNTSGISTLTGTAICGDISSSGNLQCGVISGNPLTGVIYCQNLDTTQSVDVGAHIVAARNISPEAQ